MSHSNGSTSTLFGSFFMGISDGIKAGAQELGGEELGTAFESGLSSLRSNTKADVGDKTLMDALVPAVAAMRGSKSVESAFSAAAEAAEKGQKAPNVWLLNLEGLKILGKNLLGVWTPERFQYRLF